MMPSFRTWIQRLAADEIVSTSVTMVCRRNSTMALAVVAEPRLKRSNKNVGMVTTTMVSLSLSSSTSVITARDYDVYNGTSTCPNHQIVMLSSLSSSSSQRRIAAMRILLDSLQLATANFTLSPSVATKRTAGVLERNHLSLESQDDEWNARSPLERNDVEKGEQQLLAETTPTTKYNNIDNSMNSTNHDRVNNDIVNEIANNETKLRSALRKYIYNQNIPKCITLLKEVQQENVIIPKKTTTDLFFMATQRHPIFAYQILQYYNTYYHDPDNIDSNDDSNQQIHASFDSVTKKRLSLYKRMVHCIGLLDPNNYRTKDMHKMVVALMWEIKDMSIESKQILYPNLVVALTKQRSNTVGQYANGIYNYMVEHNFDIKSGWLTRIISTSKYNRQDDLPFHDVISRLVNAGGQLHPDTILPAIQNMFPYTDAQKMCTTLDAWLNDFLIKDEWQKRQHVMEGETSEHGRIWWDREDIIDLSTLEMISTGAARNGCSKLIMLIWDILELCRYEPTQTIYENTVIAFANDRSGGIRQAFVAMTSMKDDGYIPTRPLIRSFSSAIRFNKFLIGKGRRILKDDKQQENFLMENDKLVSLESLNVIMSAYAERGDPSDAADILNLMIEYDIKPNADSYSFVIEGLGRDIKKRLKQDDESYKQKSIKIADSILSMMEESGTAPTTQVLRHYVELLCLAGEIQTATSIVKDFLSSSRNNKDEERKINNITIYRIAVENARVGNYDVAKELASMTTEVIPALYRKIFSREKNKKKRTSSIDDIKKEWEKDRKGRNHFS